MVEEGRRSGEARRADLRDFNGQGRRRDSGAVDRRAGRDSRHGGADGSGADGRRSARDGRERGGRRECAGAGGCGGPRRRPSRGASRGRGGAPPQRICASAPLQLPPIRPSPARTRARKRRRYARGTPPHQVLAARSHAWPPSTASRSRAFRAPESPAASRRRDLVQFLESGAKPTPRRAGRVHAPEPSHRGPLPEPWPGDRVEPMSKMRALISRAHGRCRATRRRT